MADQARLQYLFMRYLRRECTPEEVEELTGLLQEDHARASLDAPLLALWEEMKEDPRHYPVDWERMFTRVTAEPDMTVALRRFRLRRIGFRAAAAAAAVLLLAGGWYLWHPSPVSGPPTIAVAPSKPLVNDLPPGGNRATLTLAGGKTIVLDEAAKGTLAKQGNSDIVKKDSGVLAYAPLSAGSTSEAALYNTLATPRGGQYQLQLPDGTHVWLNAASSIRYPTAFTGAVREVAVTGEVYFEVAKDRAHPFVVTVGAMQVRVLGTHFNINAYPDETSVKTTLAEGSVQVQLNGGGHGVVMRPGQQARLDKTGRISLVPDADLDETLAWKNGLFVFHSDALPVIMRRLARWYDVDVEYKDSVIPAAHFTGTVRRQENISKMLHMLELTGGVHVEIEGRKLVVSR